MAQRHSGVSESLLLARADRLKAAAPVATGFHLDHNQQAAMQRSDVDLAIRGAGAQGEQTVALQQQPERREQFRPAPACIGFSAPKRAVHGVFRIASASA